MSHPRLSLALAAADALPPEGRIAVFRPTAETDLSDLPRDRVIAVQSFFPDAKALESRGIVAGRAQPPVCAAVVFLPRAKAEARALLAEAARVVTPGGPIWVDGLKTDGIDSVLKDLRPRLPVSDPIAKAHGKIFSFAATPGTLDDWGAQDIVPAPGFVTRPGVFSAEGIDRGSALLASCLPETLPARMADLGAGWGWLSAQVLARKGVERLDLIEAEDVALECARRNITDPRAQFHWADATTIQLDPRPLGIVMNPPFHTTRAADPALGAAFIRAAAGLLSLSGTLWMVANRHLPYEAVLRACFHEVTELTPPTGRDGAFRVFQAARPIAHASKAPQATASTQTKSALRPVLRVVRTRR